MKKHSVDPVIVRLHLTALFFFDGEESSSLSALEDTQSSLELSRAIWRSICPFDLTRCKYTGAELFDAVVGVLEDFFSQEAAAKSIGVPLRTFKLRLKQLRDSFQPEYLLGSMAALRVLVDNDPDLVLEHINAMRDNLKLKAVIKECIQEDTLLSIT